MSTLKNRLLKSRLRQLKKMLKTKTLFDLYGDPYWLRRDHEDLDEWVHRISEGVLNHKGLSIAKTRGGNYRVVELKWKTVLETLERSRVWFLISQADEMYRS
jgi:hypothetical protein